MIRPLISVIIPVYNVENYVKECVKSILKAETNCIEILLIDDGSTDSSGIICDCFADRYENVSVFHQKNQGLSSARNKGIMEAKGNFLLFVDSDDYIEAEILLKILERIQDSPDTEVFFLSAKKIYPDGRQVPLDEKFNRFRILGRTQDEVIQYLAELKKYPGSACTKAVSKKLLITHGLWFEVGKICEDLLWCLQVFLSAEKFDVIEGDYYYYRQERENSITQFRNENKLVSILDVIEDGCILAEKNKTVKKEIYSFMAYEYLIALMIYSYGKREIPKEVCIRYLKILQSYRFILLYRKDIRVRVVWYLTGILGIDFVADLVGIYYRIK